MRTCTSGPAQWLAEVYLPQIPAPRTPADPMPSAVEQPQLARRVALMVACLLALFALLSFCGALLHH